MYIKLRNPKKYIDLLPQNGVLSFKIISSILQRYLDTSHGYKKQILNSKKSLNYILKCMKKYILSLDKTPLHLKKFIPPIILDESLFLYELDFKPGVKDKIYFLQDVWAARNVHKLNPKKIIDIGSSLDYIAHIISFRDITMIDINPHDIFQLDGLSFIRSDATNLKEFDDSSIDCISSLHSAEHFGLGRYGDKIDPLGHYRFIKSMQRVVKNEGHIIFSVPSGAESYTSFNAQRVFHPSLIVEMFDQCEIVEFSALADKLYRNVALNVFDNCQGTMNSACSLFIFKKVR